MAMVEPCRNRLASPNLVVASRTPVVMPVISRRGVLSVLPNRISPVLSSSAATSVKVPPISAASLFVLVSPIKSCSLMIARDRLTSFRSSGGFVHDLVAQDANAVDFDLADVAGFHPQR